MGKKMNPEREPIQPVVVLRDGERRKWLRFASPCRVLTARRLDEVLPRFREATDAVEEEGLYAAGFVSYEAAPAFDSSLPGKADGAFPLLWFGLFPEPVVGEFLPGPAVSVPGNLTWRPSVSPGEYRRCFAAIRRYIRNGDTYQVNLTYRLRAETNSAPWGLFAGIVGSREPPHAAYVDTGEWAVLSASPELFFRLEGERIESRPMKGTAPRGRWYEDDLAQASALASAEKDRAENVMIVDMVRNDLGRVAVCGSVEVPSLFSVERHPTVWQMTSTVRARTRAPLVDIFRALFPPASITGAPKRRAMEIIAELESSPRRLYTGAIGFIAPGRRSRFNVAIRTVLIRKDSGTAEYGIGGGIVWDSTAAGELAESLAKAKVLQFEGPPFDLLETLLWSPGEGFFLLEYHLRRLTHSAEYFGFPLDPGRVREALERIAAEQAPMPRRVRLTASRDGAVRCETSEAGPEALRFADIPLAETPVDANDPFLYHKTTRRGIYEQALAMRPGSRDILLYNQKGEITETTVANVACEIDGVLCTPSLACGLLPGTYRQWLLDRGRMQEKVITVAEALGSPAVFLMNALRGMQRVQILRSG
jgi:para-aminobenzoate synthetase/4-amino-4-deoxychorismate lyase